MEPFNEQNLTKKLVSALSKDNVEFEVLFVNKNKSIKTIFDLIKRFKTLDYKDDS